MTYLDIIAAIFIFLSQLDMFSLFEVSEGRADKNFTSIRDLGFRLNFCWLPLQKFDALPYIKKSFAFVKFK